MLGLPGAVTFLRAPAAAFDLAAVGAASSHLEQGDGPRRRGRCLTFGPGGGCDVRLLPGESWADLLGRLPAGWSPDFVALELSYATVPVCLWDAPVPLVALAPDWQLQWHFLHLALPWCSLVLTDAAGVGVMARQGIGQARRLNFFGPQGLFAETQRKKV